MKERAETSWSLFYVYSLKNFCKLFENAHKFWNSFKIKKLLVTSGFQNVENLYVSRRRLSITFCKKMMFPLLTLGMKMLAGLQVTHKY